MAQNIRQNVPFIGKIAYKVKEHTYDNRMTQLIRHTIEFIRYHQLGANILNNDFEMKQAVTQINAATATYNKLVLKEIIQLNQKPIEHPFYTKYEPLRKLCLKILQNQALNFNESEEDKVYGIVFDGAWLWEEYLNTFLHENFTHTENKTSSNPVHIFKNHTSRYPDFYNSNMVLDAKYKHLKNNTKREDLHQIITYMYILGLQKGAFIYPSQGEKNTHNTIGELNGHGGNIYTFGLKIEKNCTNFQSFTSKMKENERNILNSLIEISTS